LNDIFKLISFFSGKFQIGGFQASRGASVEAQTVRGRKSRKQEEKERRIAIERTKKERRNSIETSGQVQRGA
jgi:hypothetical protein